MHRLAQEDASDIRSVLQVPEGNLQLVGHTSTFHSSFKIPAMKPQDIVLHKWQLNRKAGSDELNILCEIEWMKRQFPEAEHRIIFLWLPLMQWWHGVRSKQDTGLQQSIVTMLDWIYETLIPGLEDNSDSTPIEHLFWHYPLSGSAPVYEWLTECPKRPQIQLLD